jgi:putative membrane protein
MGTADLIPGVSGGTIAFLSGIYEELLFSIKTLSGEFLRLLLKGKFGKAIALVPFRFLIPLGVGLFTALFSLAKLLSYLLEEYPIFVWAFFFGLVLASTWIVLKRVVKWDVSDKVAFGISTIITYFVVGMIPIETPSTQLFIFLSGAIAICAMILPGISGSFILLLLGKYQQILGAVTSRDFVTLFIFTGGCVIGLALFSRALTWLFKHHHDISVAILAGIMLGSVRKIWPWQEVVSMRINSHGEEVPFIVENIWPSSFDLSTISVLLLAAAGAAIVVSLERLSLTDEQSSDVGIASFKKEHKKSLLNQ